MGSWVTRAGLVGVATFAVWQALEVPLSATAANVVPEIDGSTLSMGMTLLAGGVLLLRARRRAK